MKGGLHLGVRKGAWTEEEDNLLRKCIQIYGEGNWHQVPRRAGLNRCRKSCRLRWLNYLRPNIKRGNFTFDEVDLIIRLQKLLGNRWSLIAGRLPGRTSNDVKNYWNSHMRKKLVAQEEERAKAHQKPMKYNNIVKPRPSTLSKNLIFPTGKSAITENIQTKGNIPKPSRTSLLGDDRGAPPRQDGDMLDNLEMNSEISWFMGGSADQEPFQVPWSPGELTPAILAASESFVQGGHQSDWSGTFTCNLDLWDFLNDEQTVA